MGLIVFILLNYGISNIIVHGSIFNGFRDFWKEISPNFFGVLFSCMICTPFWTGLLTSILFNLTGVIELSPIGQYNLPIIYLTVFLDGCLSSGTTFILHIIEEHFEFNTKRD